MDLPVARLTQSTVNLTSNGEIVVQSPGVYNVMLKLTPGIKVGSYHVLCRDPQHKFKLLIIETEYSYATLNLTTIEKRLTHVMGLVDYRLVQIGVVYRQNGKLYIGNDVIKESATGELSR